MLRPLTVCTWLLTACIGAAQVVDPGPESALTMDRSIGLPLNAVKMYDVALEAWTWTFGQEPGAALRRADRPSGGIEGSARFNFRSRMLTMREESMGVVQYRVTIQTKAGECRIQVSELVHTGNRNAMLGGLDVGSIVRGNGPVQKLRGISPSSASRLHDEIRTASTARIQELLTGFEARMRAAAQP